MEKAEKSKGEEKRVNEKVQILLFSVGDCVYGIEVSSVRKVIEPGPITRLSHTTPHILGVTKADGKIYIVMDLRSKFGIKTVKPAAMTAAILLACEDLDLCILVDQVLSVEEINGWEEVSGQDECITGTIQMKGENIWLVTAERLTLKP